jgi:two-component system cell cycle sensor histidine kinase PleC
VPTPTSSTKSADSGYVFQIADTGIGIAFEDIPQARPQFGQVDSDLNRRYQSAGLGMTAMNF